jgi:hypothetical protein
VSGVFPVCLCVFSNNSFSVSNLCRIAPRRTETPPVFFFVKRGGSRVEIPRKLNVKSHVMYRNSAANVTSIVGYALYVILEIHVRHFRFSVRVPVRGLVQVAMLSNQCE